jgi:hypothetical protein
MNTETILIGVNLAIFAISPFLPNVVYTYFVDTYAGIVVLLLAALYSITFGYLVTVSSFVAIASLYSESHARKAKNIKGRSKATHANEFETQIQPSPDLVPNELHPEMEEPVNEDIQGVPANDDGDNSFKPVDSSINEKVPLPTVSFSKDAEDIYLKDNLAENSLKE